MSLRGALMCLCWLAVLSQSAAADDDETPPQNCSSSTLYESLSADLQVALQCREPPSGWSHQQTAALLLSARRLSYVLHQHQLTECLEQKPVGCPTPEVPDYGGLACITVANAMYCKPLCNHGFDFAFMRLRNAFSECSERNNYRWSTPYIGGNRLAVCNKVPFIVSSGASSYFPKGQDCLTSRSSAALQSVIAEAFAAELRGSGVEAEPRSVCLMCG